MRKFLPAVGLLFALFATAPAFAQCAAVPALPDTERRTQYSITAQTGPFAVGFQIFGDGTDYANWINVYVNNVLLASSAYTVTSASTNLATGCRPITDAMVTFTLPQTGAVQIVGARRPRQTSQFPENRGVAARELNQRLSDMTAVERERWDAIQRTIQAPPGESLNMLPPAATRASTFPCFDVTGQLITCTGSPTGVTFVGGTIGADVFFGSGRPWCDVRAKGAVGNGSTDDSAAFQACIDAVALLGGGIVFVSPTANGYCITNTIAISQGVTLRGAGPSTILSVCGNDIQMISLTGSRSAIEDMHIYGKGMPVPGDVTFGASHPTVRSLPSAVQNRVINVTIQGGSIPLQMDGTDTYTANFHTNSFYGNALLYASTGGWYHRLQLDMVWPAGLPNPGHAAIVARANSTAYSVGDVVTFGCVGPAATYQFYIQAVVAGTSGGSPPSTCAHYGLNFTDGSVQWQIANPVGSSCMQIDGAFLSEIQIIQMDAGSCENGLSITNSQKAHTRVSQCVISGNVLNAVNASLGNDLLVEGCEIAGGFTAGGTGIKVGAGWGGETRVANSMIWSGQYGVDIRGGSNTTIIGNGIYGMTASGVHIGTGVSNFVVSGNTLGSSAAGYGTNSWGVIVDAGASDHYNIVNNITFGATNFATTKGIADAGAGVNKTISGNN